MENSPLDVSLKSDVFEGEVEQHRIVYIGHGTCGGKSRRGGKAGGFGKVIWRPGEPYPGFMMCHIEMTTTQLASPSVEIITQGQQ